MRKVAAYALGEIGSQEAVPHLIEALKVEYRLVHEAAAEALEKIGWQPQNQEEKNLYLIAKRAWDELVKIEPPLFLI